MANYGLFDDTTILPKTRNGIPYEIDALSYREMWTPGASKTVVLCRVKTNQAEQWVQEMVGTVSTGIVDGVIRLRRDPPEKNPINAQLSRQYCTRLEQVDQGDFATTGVYQNEGVPTFAQQGSGWPRTKWMRFKATFEGMPFEVRTDAQVDEKSDTYEREILRYVVRGQRSQPREQQIPGGGFRVISANPANRHKLMNTGFKTIIFADVTYTWVRVPVHAIPTAAWSHQGKINSVIFDTWDEVDNPAGYGWDVGTVLYTGFDDTNKYYDANGDWVCDVVYSFKVKNIGWQFYLNNLGEAVEVSSDGTSSGTRPYETADLHELFRAYTP